MAVVDAAPQTDAKPCAQAGKALIVKKTNHKTYDLNLYHHLHDLFQPYCKHPPNRRRAKTYYPKSCRYLRHMEHCRALLIPQPHMKKPATLTALHLALMEKSITHTLKEHHI
jgi:hypothetical protein